MEKPSDILLTMQKLAQDNDIHTPYIVGGFARDKVMGRTGDMGDLDITTGHPDCRRFSKIVAAHFVKKYPDLKFKEIPGHHSSIKFAGLDFDFSAYNVFPYVPQMLKRVGVKEPSSMLKEVMSRDFTCNTLLMTLDFKTVKDPTGMGVQDIKKKIIRCLIPPRISLRGDPKSIIRAIYLSAKLGFEIEPEIIKWANRNPEYIKYVSVSFIKNKLGKAIDYSPERTIKAMDDLRVWRNIPLIDKLMPYAEGRI